MKFLTFLFCLSFLSFQSYGQPDLSAKSYFGYEPGEQFSYHHDVKGWFEKVAGISPKVEYIPYGKTYEGRPLFVVAVSTPANIEDLEEIRNNNLINAGLMPGKISGKSLPIVWLSYNIHGDEAASTEAAILTLEKLIGDDEGINTWLSEMIVIIDPCENPDGRERYVNWYRQAQNLIPNVHLDSREHSQLWPGGRYNHYLFDLNRDWAWQTQIESQNRAALYHKWMPQVHVDLHEMGINQPYYFAPAARPFHKEISQWQYDFQVHAGNNHAKYFDSEGWLYFTKEVFDLFYPSYGDTWPTFHGAIGFTYEKGGSGAAGLAVLTETGDTLSLKDRVLHHMTTSLSTIETAYKHRQKLLQEFSSYFYSAVHVPSGKYKSYVLKYNGQEDRVKGLLQLLDGQLITYSVAESSGSNHKGYSYESQKQEDFKIEKNDIIIPTSQPMSRMLKVLFEPESVLEDSLTYDLTAWCLPYVYNVKTFASFEEIPSGKSTTPPFIKNEVPEKQAYGYISSWKSLADLQLLALLQKNDFKIRQISSQIKVENQLFGRGSFLILRSDNFNLGKDFDQKVLSLANELSRPLVALKGGMNQAGPDYGSSSIKFMKNPSVAILSGDDIYPTEFGAIWHFFEQVIKYPVTVLTTERIGRIDPSGYDVLILPAGNYSDKELAEQIFKFLDSGCRVIAIEEAISLFESDKTELSKSVQKQKTLDEVKKDGTPNLTKYADAMRKSISNGTPGSIHRVDLDNTHPLAYGEDVWIPLIKLNSKTYPYLENGWNVGIYKNKSQMSGFTGYTLKKKLPETMAIGMEYYGNSEIIYFVDPPVFRGFWYCGNLLLGNAIFMP